MMRIALLLMHIGVLNLAHANNLRGPEKRQNNQKSHRQVPIVRDLGSKSGGKSMKAFKSGKSNRDNEVIRHKKQYSNERNKITRKPENTLTDKKFKIEEPRHPTIEEICPHPVKCAFKKGNKDRRGGQKTMIAVCHHIAFLDEFKTICIEEDVVGGHLEVFEDDYCGICTTISTSSSSTPLLETSSSSTIPWQAASTEVMISSTSSSTIMSSSSTSSPDIAVDQKINQAPPAQEPLTSTASTTSEENIQTTLSGSGAKPSKSAVGTCTSGKDCALGVCAHESLASDSPTICCQSGKQFHLGLEFNDFRYYCTDQPLGTVCVKGADASLFSDDICESKKCVWGRCASTWLDNNALCSLGHDCASGACGYESIASDAAVTCCPSGKRFHLGLEFNDFRHFCSDQKQGTICEEGDLFSEDICESGTCIDGKCSSVTSSLLSSTIATTNTITTSSTSDENTQTEPTDSQETVIPTKSILDTENDFCEDAIPITSTNIVIKGSTEFATADFESELEEKCGTALGARGVWFRIKGSNRKAVIKLEYQLFSLHNGRSEFSVFTGPCGDLVCVANLEGRASPSWTSDWNDLVVFEFIPTPGETYLFLLTGQTAETGAEYELRISEYDIPVNDECIGSIQVSPFPIPEIVMGDNFGGTPDYDEFDIETCGINWKSRGVWYGLKGRGTSVRLEYQLNAYHQGNTELSLYKGPCDDLECIVNKEASPSPSWSNEYNDLLVHEFFAEDGETYKLLLTGSTFDTTGFYEMKISEYSIPSNDQCKDATEIKSFKKIYPGSTLGATPDFEDSDLPDACGVAVGTRGVWFRLVGHGKVLRLEYQLNSYHQDKSILSVFTGSCGELECVSNAEGRPSPSWSSNFNDMVVHEFMAEDGKMYLLYLSGGNFDTAGEYDLIISEV